MSFPAPRPGLVVRYSFLWSHERGAGADEGVEDRPCAIVVAARRGEDHEITVIVAPITHAPPDDPADSVEIPAAVRRSLGLGGERQWLRADELNRFTWPGFDLRVIPGRAGDYAYGMLPRPLFEELRASILARQAVKAARVQRRD